MSIRLVIVDGQSTIIQRLKELLNYFEEEFTIADEAQHGEEVVEKVLASKPDVVMMDINIPGKNAVEITAELKQKIPKSKVLALTEDSDQQHLSQIIKAGALGYILKDIEPESLYEAIRTVARGDAYIQPCLLSKLLTELRQFLNEEKKVIMPEHLGLTQRELEIVSYIACGESNKEIAERLFISEKTVKNHVSNILRKMALEDRTQVAVYAYRQGLITK